MYVLGIETSCDETSVAVLDGEGRVLSNRIASQIERHRPFGGVVPEIASREHLDHLMPVLDLSLADAGIPLEGIGRVAVTSGPGLIGALLVGVAAAQGVAWMRGIPVAGVNHLEGHIFSPLLQTGMQPARPLPGRFWSLVLSGGHSSVYEIRAADGSLSVRTLNRTRDDAAGEIFDKVGKVLGFPYPGGPWVDRLASGGDPSRFVFGRARFKDEMPDFSFSGLKSNAIREARGAGLEGIGTEPSRLLSDFCASFQAAIGDQIENRLERLWPRVEEQRPLAIGLAGGVAANRALRSVVAKWAEGKGIELLLADPAYCTDNAAMIAWAALVLGESVLLDPVRVPVRSRVTVDR